MQNIQMVDLKNQYDRIREEVDQAVLNVLRSTQFINGPAVRDFSSHLAAYLGVPHVIPCANGTDALQIAMMALDLKPGDEVITTPFTFVATVEVIALLGLKPVFVDVHADTFNMDESLIDEAVTDMTKCIVPIHLFGQAANMEAILQIAHRHNLFVVEDNAQAIGATVRMSNGEVHKAGTVGHIGCTSFFPSKNLGCYGDGGAMFTRQDNLARRMASIANHGSAERYYHDEVGVNSRLDTLQAAILDIKLRHLDQYNQLRQEAAARYDALLQGIPGVIVPARSPFSTHVFHQYTLRLPEHREQVKKALEQAGVPHGIYYPVPLHLQRAYREYGYQKGQFPVSEQLAHEVISLPMHTELTGEMQERICDVIRRALLHS